MNYQITSIQQFNNSTIQQHVNSTTRQFNNSSTQQLNNSTTRQLNNSTTRQLNNSTTQQLNNSTTQQLNNSSTHQHMNFTEARTRIRPHIRHTPLEHSVLLSQMTGANVYLKLENWQLTGSFKLRGAMNKLLSIPESERQHKTFVAASTGNHAAGFAYAVQKLGLRGEVFLPEHVSPSKLEYLRSFGVPLHFHGQDSLETEIHTRAYADKHGHILVHPYNDPDIIAGQGTIGVEIAQDLPEVEAVFVPVGGGGLIAGIGGYLKSYNTDIEMVGCQPENSPEMSLSIEQGHIIEELIAQPTLSDGTAGGIEQGAITFDLCKKLVDKFVLISEKEIANALLWLIKNRQMIVEGSAGLALATLLKNPEKYQGKNVVLIVCGRRLSYEKLRNIMDND